MAKATIASLTSLCERVIEHGAPYHVERKGELFYDALLYPLLDYVHGPAKRQVKLKLRPGQRRRSRIDFQLGGGPKTVVELACRTHFHSLSPSQNRSELNKLTRQRTAATRFLVLLDPSGWPPLDKDVLVDQYRSWNPGRGRFARLPVRIIYVRPSHSFHFVWRAA